MNIPKKKEKSVKVESETGDKFSSVMLLYKRLWHTFIDRTYTHKNKYSLKDFWRCLFWTKKKKLLFVSFTFSLRTVQLGFYRTRITRVVPSPKLPSLELPFMNT